MKKSSPSQTFLRALCLCAFIFVFRIGYGFKINYLGRESHHVHFPFSAELIWQNVVKGNLFPIDDLFPSDGGSDPGVVGSIPTEVKRIFSLPRVVT